MEPLTKLHKRLLLHQFCLTLLSEGGESNKNNANEVSYEASYEALLTRKTRLKKYNEIEIALVVELAQLKFTFLAIVK